MFMHRQGHGTAFFLYNSEWKNGSSNILGLAFIDCPLIAQVLELNLASGCFTLPRAVHCRAKKMRTQLMWHLFNNIPSFYLFSLKEGSTARSVILLCVKFTSINLFCPSLIWSPLASYYTSEKLKCKLNQLVGLSLLKRKISLNRI